MITVSADFLPNILAIFLAPATFFPHKRLQFEAKAPVFGRKYYRNPNISSVYTFLLVPISFLLRNSVKADS
jgi:hypothetical protein